MFYSVSELAGVVGMPKLERNTRMTLNKLCESNCDWKRKREGTKAFEYSIECLPIATKQHLLQQEAQKLAEEKVSTAASCSVSDLSKQDMWSDFESATDSVRKEAQRKLGVALHIKAFMNDGDSFSKAAASVSEKTGVAIETLRNWFYRSPKLNQVDPSDWLAAFTSASIKKGVQGRRVEFSEEAKEFFKKDYLRPQTTIASAHRLTVQVAEVYGWKVPSIGTVRAWVESNIPFELVVLYKEGKAAVRQTLVPPQRRTRKDMHAMEIVNGDGHTARVDCMLDNGSIIRPTIWVFQDVYSSAIVGYSIDVSENNEMLSIAIGNMIASYGLPKKWLFDRGSAALSDQVTGTMTKPNKKGKYKKFTTAKLEGLLQTLGYSSADIHWSAVFADTVGNKGNARAKPVERVFRDEDGIGVFERSRQFQGCYTGSGVYSRPADYEGGKRGVPLRLFCELFDAWVAQYNAQKGRRTEMGGGTKSFQQVFEESYAVSQVKMPTQEQVRLCLLRQETVTVQKSGLFELKASQYISKDDSHYKTNKYQSDALYSYIGEQVSIRYNPYNMHSEVYAYELSGRFIGQIAMLEDAGFMSVSHKRLVNLKQAKLSERMTALEQAYPLMDDALFDEMAASVRPEKETGLGSVVPGISEMVPSLPRRIENLGQKNTVSGERNGISNSVENDEFSEFDEVMHLFKQA
ncbi:transposase domain-containing protein [Shewanella halifaxensis]|uniref:transposase domain-containing protein n=1 Tax=Shewanella halifaxensis TaxID=271098 RepID=UPI000D59891E|nr:transposase domain-containing protein [Shewanella halifaxensis]